MNTKEFIEYIKSNEEIIKKAIKKDTNPSIVPGILNPIKFTVYENNFMRDVILPDEENKEKCPLVPGAIIGGNHFGFNLINKTTNESIIFPTQCRIDGICIDTEENTIKVYENGKFHPWKFDLKGNLLSIATFEYYSRKDLRYIQENFNDDSNEKQNCAKVNSYVNKN